MNIKEYSKDVNWKALIIGSAFTVFIAIYGFRNNLDIILPFSSIGLLVIGYTAKNIKWGGILGAIGALPLYVAAVEGMLGPLTSSINPITLNIILLIVCLFVGVIIGLIGAYVKVEREKAKIEKAKIGKNKKKKKRKK